jgi:heme exporter protein D
MPRYATSSIMRFFQSCCKLKKICIRGSKTGHGVFIWSVVSIASVLLMLVMNLLTSAAIKIQGILCNITIYRVRCNALRKVDSDSQE